MSGLGLVGEWASGAVTAADALALDHHQRCRAFVALGAAARDLPDLLVALAPPRTGVAAFAFELRLEATATARHGVRVGLDFAPRDPVERWSADALAAQREAHEPPSPFHYSRERARTERSALELALEVLVTEATPGVTERGG